MKKIIAISMMFALVAGAVFADTSVSGALEVRFHLAKQVGAEDADPVMGGSMAAAQIRLTGSNTDGTLGGLFNFRNTDTQPRFHRTFVWWKPTQQVKVFLGIDMDGLFDTADIAGWSFHSGDNDYLFNHHWDFWRQIFPGNWDGFGLAVSFYPVAGFDLNLALPTGGVNWNPGDKTSQTPFITDQEGDANKSRGMIPGRLRLVGNYSLDFGKISFVYLGGGNVIEKGVQFANIEDKNKIKNSNGLFGASVLVTAIDGIAIKAGGSAILTDPDMIINGGVAVAYNGDGFGVKARAGFTMQGDADMFLTANVMPFFAAGDKGQALVDFGLSMQGDKMGWWLTPAYRLSMEGGAFKIGLQIFNNVQFGGNVSINGAEYVKWAVPMLLAFNF